MFNLLAFTIAIHGLSAAIWVGGMFFAYICLRPSLGSFEPPLRLQLWAGVFRRFFPWVWMAIIILPVTGYIHIFGVYGSFDNLSMHIHFMHVVGWVMICFFVLLYYLPYRRFRSAVAAEDWPDAAKYLNTVRQIVATNLLLGMAVIFLATTGRFWG